MRVSLHDLKVNAVITTFKITSDYRVSYGKYAMTIVKKLIDLGLP